MRINKTIRGAATAALAFGLTAAVAASANAQDDKKLRYKMHAAFASSLPVLGPAGKRIEQTIKEVSAGNMEFKHFEPGALVPAIAYYDPVGAGAIDMAYGTPGYGVGKVPALAYLTAVPFGPNFGEFHAWVKYGGGKELYDEMYDAIGLRGVFCATIPPESSGWFRKEIKSLDELKGLKMRFFGLGAKVMEKFGVSTQLLAAGDIYPALELGAIDATEFSMPSIDEGLGFFQVAKHYYFPGWHQPASLGDVIFPKAKYDALSKQQKDWIRITCGYQIFEEFVDGERQQPAAINRMKAKGVTLHKWSPEILAKLEAVWKQVAAEEAAKDPVMKKVSESYFKYREEYAFWGQNGYLK
ncbi:MAG: TRAP transporter substrate-binding protein [Alphaproteobacteria bacterium]|nr:TRAP transporter substrate-binding protein [Alphaproteobacteria bacterium]